MLSSAPPSSNPRRLRPNLRQATFILPKTGQRLKGLVTLRSSVCTENGNHGERTPLLSEQRASGIERQGIVARIRGKAFETWHWVRQFAASEAGKGVFKCSLAYLLGSLATFIPAIAALLGHQDGKHVVATITVYFHPARSRGSMLKASICAFLAFLYAAFISITSMCVAMFFESTLHLLFVGHILVLIVFCGGGLGFIGWTKQKLGDPLVNVACSLASLAIITVLTKEGAVQVGDLSFSKISQVLKMVIMGVTATMAVSFLIFPISAQKKLRSNLVTMTDTLAIMLGIITESFLSGSEEELQAAEFISASTRNKKAYDLLDKLLKESKLEHYVAGTEREYRIEKKLVRWVQDITQNMGGLRSAATLQFQLLKQAKSSEPTPGYNREPSPSKASSPISSPNPWPFQDGPVVLASRDERPQKGISDTNKGQASSNGEVDASTLLSPADMFELFITHLGPSMRSLAFTLKEILQELPFGPAPDYKVLVNGRFRISLDRALELYRTSREEALRSLYRQKDIMKIKTLETEADLEEVSASCGHFSFSLLKFGEQLKDLLAILDELQLESEEKPNGRSWNWLKFWRPANAHESGRSVSDLEQSPVDPIGEADLRVRCSSPENRPNLTDGSPKKIPTSERISYRIWKSLRVFRRDETKFAIKVGTGAALYALPSFLPSTRPFYSYWRGEWGLLSYMLVCSMTIGASNTTGYARFLGTSLGALCAITAWYITGGNVFGLAFLGWVMATWTAYIILVKGKGPMGRFIMLTYNLSALYAYLLLQNEGEDDQDEGGIHPIITEIILHRVVAVFTGCVWGIIITRIIWPISARKKLKHGLSLLWLRMSLIWKRDPLSMMVNGKTAVAYMSPREKLEIERFLSHLETLQVAARSEYSLKRPFPDAAYGNILRRTRRMLDAFHAMNLEILKNLTASEGEISILRYTAQERLQLSARISHLLSVMASSMKLEYPLNDVLPNIDHARDRLLARIFHYRKDTTRSRLTTDEDYALLYAYVLVTGQLSNEIMEIMAEIRRLFGMLDEDVVKLQ